MATEEYQQVEVRTWLKMTVSTDKVMADAIEDFMVGVLGAGVETGVEDGITTRIINGYVEQENLSSEEMLKLVAALEAHLNELATIFKKDIPVLEYTTIGDEDWSNNWKLHFAPFQVIPGLVIVPSWEDYEVLGGEKVIEMDPGMAFGTGHHPTTAMSLRLIKNVVTENPGAAVLDVGTGTGVLGMAALLYGASSVTGIDNDIEAVIPARENVVKNKMEERMEVSITDLVDVEGCYNLVVANIIHDVLQLLREDLVKRISPMGRLVLSGLLSGDQVDSIITSFTKSGELGLINKDEEGEWTALLFGRKE